MQYDIYHNAALYYTDEQDKAVKEVTNLYINLLLLL